MTVTSKTKKNKLSVLKSNAPNHGRNKRQRDYAEKERSLHPVEEEKTPNSDFTADPNTLSE